MGYSTQTIQVLAGKPLKVDFVLNELLELVKLVVLGSRAAPRSQTGTAVAVDVIDTRSAEGIYRKSEFKPDFALPGAS